MRIKHLINAFLATTFGYQIRALHAPIQSFEEGMRALSRVVSADALIDVGVALGTPELYDAFPKATLLLVEANPRFASELERIKKQRPGTLDELVFCGASAGQIELVDSNQSSSMYEREQRRKDRVRVPMETLDALVARNNLEGKDTILKIDVEGAEMEVLKGAERTLAQTKAVIIEVSWSKNEEGAHYLEELQFLHTRGFELFNIIEGGGIKEHGRLAHADFVFVKR